MKRCNAEETGSCSGGYEPDTPGRCNTCGGSYYGGHAWAQWSSAGNGTHTRSCTNYCREVDTAKCTGGKDLAPKRSARRVVAIRRKRPKQPCSGAARSKNPHLHGKGLERLRNLRPLQLYHLCGTARTEILFGIQQSKIHPPVRNPARLLHRNLLRRDYTTYVERPALKHDLRQRVIKAPTCTQMGWAYSAVSAATIPPLRCCPY